MEDATRKYDYQSLAFRLTDLTSGRKATCRLEEDSNNLVRPIMNWSVTIETGDGELLSLHSVPTQEEASKMAARMLTPATQTNLAQR